MTQKLPVSVFIVTKNEEKNLPRLLASISPASQVVIVDSGSTDRTLAIAQDFGAELSHQDWLGMTRQKEVALAKCTQPWVFNLDADEEVSPELWDEIAALIAEDKANGLRIPLTEVFIGVKNHPLSRRNYYLRFFRRSAGKFGAALVHAGVEVQGEVREAVADMFHYGEVSLLVKVNKINLYSSQVADEKFAKGKTPSLLKLVLVMPLMFFKSYIVRRNFLNGRRGFIGSLINAFYAFLKEAKLYELHLNRRLNGE